MRPIVRWYLILLIVNGGASSAAWGASVEEQISLCDELAASSLDPERPASVRGVPFDAIDADRAIPACEAAINASQGDPRLWFQYGRALQRGGRLPEAVSWYQKASDAGLSLAQNNLATILEKGGDGVAVDRNTAFLLTKKAADSGLLIAKGNLANYYRDGIGTAVNKGAALQLYLSLAKDGSVDGMRNAAYMLESGEDTGVPDPEAASAYWRTLAKSGDTEGQYKVGIGIAQGRIKSQSSTEMVDMLAAAASAGSRGAAQELANAYKDGKNVDRDANKAAKYAYLALDIASGADVKNEDGWLMYQHNAAQILLMLDEQGILKARNISELQKLREDFSAKGLMRYSIPVVCGTENVPFELFIWDWGRDYAPSDPQFEWLEASRGCKAATSVRTRFQKLFAIAKEKNISYSALTKSSMTEDQPNQQQAVLNREAKTGTISTDPSNQSTLGAVSELIEHLSPTDAKPEELISNGQKHYQQQQFQQALMFFNHALTLYKGRQDHENTIATLLLITQSYMGMQQLQKALEAGQQALHLAEQTAGVESAVVVTCLYALALTHLTLAGDSVQAISLFERALAIQEKTLGSEHADIARTLNSLGGLYLARSDFTRARPLLERTLAINEKAHGSEHANVAQSLFNLGIANQALGDFAQAKVNLERSLAIREKIFGPEHELVAKTLAKLANVIFAPDANAQAKALYERALAINQKIYGPEHPSVATNLNDLADLNRRLGDYGAAKILYERAIAIREKIHGPEYIDMVTSLSGLAGLYMDIDDYSKAKPLIERSFAIIDKFNASKPDAGWEKLFKHFAPLDSALILSRLADLYLNLGEYTQAKVLIERSLPIYTKAFGPDHVVVTIALSKLADLHLQLGEYAQAKPVIDRVLEIREKTVGDEDVAITHNLTQLASVHAAGGDYVQAKPLVERSLKIREKAFGTEHATVARSLNDLGFLYCKLNNYIQAKPLLERALRIALINHQPQLLWSVQANISQLFSELKQPEAAILFGKQAVNNLQAQRGRLAVLEEDLQKSFLSSVSKYYQWLARLLIEQGRLPEAQQVLTMLKEEEYYEFIHRDSEDNSRSTRISFTPAEADWQGEYQKITDQLVMLGEEVRLLKIKKSVAPTEIEDARIRELGERLEVTAGSFHRSLDKLATIFDLASSTYTQKQTKLKLENDLTELVRELGNDVVLLQTVTMDDSVWLLLTTSESRKVHKVKVSKKELNQHIHAFRERLRMTEFDPRQTGQTLYKLIFQPLEIDLQLANAKVLMMSLDGALRYIPFAALHDGKNYLIERYALSFLNEAIQDNLKIQPKTNWKVAGLGTSEQYPGFSPLPAVAAELNGIVRKNETDSNGVMDGIIRLNRDFDQEQLRSVMRGEYPVLHIASHYEFKPGFEKDSFLLLGDGSHLDLEQIRQGNYSFKGVDLFTLSACNTAIGGTGEGREVEGLAVLAQKKGAKGVLATLWSVADQSTSILMQTMYRLHQTQKLSKANALRQAQLALLRGAATGDTRPELTREATPSAAPVHMKTYHTDKRRPYAHPYFWAPFILMGNWL